MTSEFSWCLLISNVSPRNKQTAADTIDGQKKVEVEIERGLRFNHPTTGLRYVALLRGGFPRPVQWMYCMNRLRYPEQESLQYDPIIS